MAYFLFVFVLYLIVALLYERGMPGGAWASAGRVLFAALFYASLLSACSVAGYILFG